MNRLEILVAVAEAELFIDAAKTAILQIDTEIKRMHEWHDIGDGSPKGSDRSYGSKQTGTLRRRSMDLTRSLAQLRK